MAYTALFQQRAQAQYLRTQEQTVSPGQAVVMLYHGCARIIGRGRAALEAKDYETARQSFLRAQDIVVELNGCLNLDGGEIAQNLSQLYDYLHGRLIQANIKRDAQAAAEVEQFFREMAPAWEEALRQCTGRQPASPTTATTAIPSHAAGATRATATAHATARAMASPTDTARLALNLAG
ncbi:MAG: flagellar export chaperone FliS [Chloroflexota bacterium]